MQYAKAFCFLLKVPKTKIYRMCWFQWLRCLIFFCFVLLHSILINAICVCDSLFVCAVNWPINVYLHNSLSTIVKRVWQPTAGKQQTQREKKTQTIGAFECRKTAHCGSNLSASGKKSTATFLPSKCIILQYGCSSLRQCILTVIWIDQQWRRCDTNHTKQ